MRTSTALLLLLGRGRCAANTERILSFLEEQQRSTAAVLQRLERVEKHLSTRGPGGRRSQHHLRDGPRDRNFVPLVPSAGGKRYLTDPLYMRLYKTHDVYANLTLRPFDVSGWGTLRSLYNLLLEAMRPRLVVEIGVWKGASCAIFASGMKRLNMPGRVLAVDTWLGAVEMWDRHQKDTSRDLEWVNGFPSVYYTFLSNMVQLGVQNYVIPFPAPSQLVGQYFQRKGHRLPKPDLVHLDASHEYEDVRRDVEQWWPLLSPTGVLLGDDYLGYWVGVKRAVDEFVGARNLTLHTFRHKWYLFKNQSHPGFTDREVEAQEKADGYRRFRENVDRIRGRTNLCPASSKAKCERCSKNDGDADACARTHVSGQRCEYHHDRCRKEWSWRTGKSAVE